MRFRRGAPTAWSALPPPVSRRHPVGCVVPLLLPAGSRAIVWQRPHHHRPLPLPLRLRHPCAKAALFSASGPRACARCTHPPHMLPLRRTSFRRTRDCGAACAGGRGYKLQLPSAAARACSRAIRSARICSTDFLGCTCGNGEPSPRVRSVVKARGPRCRAFDVGRRCASAHFYCAVAEGPLAAS